MLTRRQFMHQIAAATAAAATIGTMEQLAVAAEGRAGKAPDQSRPPALTPFKDPLLIPPVLRPDESKSGISWLTIRLRAANVQLHSELPPTPVWGYEGQLPGPTIEVHRGQRLRIEYVNDLPIDEPFPVTAVLAPNKTQNDAGRSGAAPDANVASLVPWIVTHVHGGRTTAASDGWTENAIYPGQTTVFTHENDQPATMLWYHDHALGITRYNVYAGLAGAYIIRDKEEVSLGLPAGPYELPLIIQDRNLDALPDGRLNGRLLHKTTDDTMEFFGPFTSVNGRIWPYAEVEARQYRLRVLNASNSRTYRLVLLDEAGNNILHRVTQIGTDGGLLAEPVAPPADGVTLASAERADLIVDFRSLNGQRVTLVNTAQSPFKGNPSDRAPGQADPAQQVPYPQVMQFRVGSGQANDSFVLPQQLSSYRRLYDNGVPAGSTHRMIGLVKHEINGMQSFHLHELEKVDSPRHGEPLIAVLDESGITTKYRTVATAFEDTVNFMIADRSMEVWHFLNLSKSTHPMHVHLVQFQAIGRSLFDINGFDGKTLATKEAVKFKKTLRLDANELGPKDTIRVNPGELLSVAMTFNGYAGRYMYHCHMLEHEDMDMMRPYVVAPAGALTAMGMGPMNGHGMKM